MYQINADQLLDVHI